MNWQYEPIPRYVVYTPAGTEIGEIVLEDGSFAGLDIDEHWHAIADGGSVGRAVLMDEARELVVKALRTRGLSAVRSLEPPEEPEKGTRCSERSSRWRMISIASGSW